MDFIAEKIENHFFTESNRIIVEMKNLCYDTCGYNCLVCVVPAADGENVYSGLVL